MSKYKKLTSLFYEDKDRYQSLYNERFHSESCTHLPLSVAGAPAFFLTTSDMAVMIEKILSYNADLTQILGTLPEAALDMLKEEIIIEEIMVTNDIEGVRSTRKEIADALEASKRKDRTLRFQGIVNKYVQLLFVTEQQTIQSCQDIRDIYNEIVSQEIEKPSLPDGTIFRKDPVSIYTSTDKEIHKGIFPEENLILFMEKSISILSEDISFLIAVSVFHYLFGYAHPFYDGNGRTDRFISSMLLNHILNPLISSRISYTIKNNKNKYQKCFELCNDPKNKGDITHFVLFFLSVIEKSAKNIHHHARELTQKFKYYGEIIWTQTNLDREHKLALHILAQASLFKKTGVHPKEVAGYLNKGEQTTSKILKSLVEPFHLEIIKDGKKHLYYLNLESLDALTTQ